MGDDGGRRKREERLRGEAELMTGRRREESRGEERTLRHQESLSKMFFFFLSDFRDARSQKWQPTTTADS